MRQGTERERERERQRERERDGAFKCVKMSGGWCVYYASHPFVNQKDLHSAHCEKDKQTGKRL